MGRVKLMHCRELHLAARSRARISLSALPARARLSMGVMMMKKSLNRFGMSPSIPLFPSFQFPLPFLPSLPSPYLSPLPPTPFSLFPSPQIASGANAATPTSPNATPSPPRRKPSASRTPRNTSTTSTRTTTPRRTRQWPSTARTPRSS